MINTRDPRQLEGSGSALTATVQDPSLVVIGADVDANSLVNVYDSGGGVQKIRPADASLGREAHGFVKLAGTAGQTATVYPPSGYSILSFGGSAGTVYFLGDAGAIVSTATTDAYQVVGRTRDEDTLIVEIDGMYDFSAGGGGTWGSITGTLSAQTDLQAALDAKGSGTVTSVSLTAPTGLTVTGSPITASGTLALSLTAGYAIPTTTALANAATAFGWGDHSAAGYLTSFTETNDLGAAVTWANIPIANVPTGTSGTTVALGNHTHAGVYEPVDGTIVRTGDAAWNAGDWDTAFSWGNHASAGYLTSSSIDTLAELNAIVGVTLIESTNAALTDARTPLSHAHGNIANGGTVGTTANLPLITGTAGIVQAGAFGTGAAQFCEGNDSRLSDARTPAAHAATHTNGTDDIQSATAAQKGLATAAQIAKLDGIATGANNYSHPNHSGAVTSTGDGATALGSFTLSQLNTAISDATVATGGGTATGTNTGDQDLSGYSLTSHTHEGTAILSTGEAGGVKFLREDGDNSSSWQSIEGSYVGLAKLGTPAYYTLQQVQDVVHSTGWVSGGAVTDGGSGTVDVAAGVGLLRATDSNLVTLYFCDWDAATGLALTDNDTNYIYVGYNAGDPAVAASTTDPTGDNTKILLARVYREATSLRIFEGVRQTIGDHALLMMRSMSETMPFAHVSGAATTEAGTRQLQISAGVFWHGLTRIETSVIDTTGVGTFDAYYRDGVGGWTEVTGQTAINNTQYDDGSGTLATLTANRYGVHWVYLSSASELAVVFGRDDYQIGAAQDAMVPTPPESLLVDSRLIAKIIVQKSAATFTSVESAFMTMFQGSPISGGGDVLGSASSTDNAIVRFDGAGGKTIQNSGITIADGASGTLSGTNTGDQDLSGYLTTATAASTYQPLDTQLTDLAGLAYASNSLKVVRVNAGETGFELATISAGGGDVTSASNIADNAIVRGDGGSKGVQESVLSIADTTGYISSSHTEISLKEVGGTGVATSAGTVKLVSDPGAGPITLTWDGASFLSDSGGGYLQLGCSTMSGFLRLDDFDGSAALQSRDETDYWRAENGTISGYTNSVSRLDITDSGVRFGGAGDRITTLGTGAAAALAINVGSSGAFLANNGSAANLTSFPTLNQNTSGTAAGLSATLAVGSGGTGLTALGTALQILRVNAGATALEYATLAGGGDLLAANNLSDLANAAAARTNLGIAIGTNVQAYDADLTTWAGLAPSANAQSLVTAANYAAMRTLLDLEAGTDFYSIAGADAAFAAIGHNHSGVYQPLDSDLTAIAGLTSAADKGIQFTGAGTAATFDLTAAGKALLDDADASAQRTTLGLVIGTNVQAYDADLTTWAGITPGTGVGTALAVNTGSAGAVVLFDGAGGTPSSLVGTNITGTAASLTVGGFKVVTKSTAANYTVGTTSALEAYGGIIYVTAACTITLPAVVAGMNFTIITVGAVAVHADPNAADKMILDGVTLDDGDKATNTSASGDIIHFAYYSADGWYATSYGATGGAWTDGG